MWSLLHYNCKYSWTQHTSVIEYNSINPNTFNFGIAGAFVGILLLIILIILTSIYNAGSCETRHYYDDKITQSKSSVVINQIATIVYLSSSFMYFFIGYNYYQPYLFAEFILYSIIVSYYVFYLPFYSYHLNLIKIFIHFDCSLIILVFWIGYCLDNAGITLLVTLVMQVFLFVLAILILNYRIARIETNPELYYKHFEDFELSIRNYLKSGELKESLIAKLDKNFKTDENLLNRIAQAYYCNDMLKNTRLAYNKIIVVKYHRLNFFLNFQIYKCKKIMKKLCNKSTGGYKIYQYIVAIENLALKDCEFCEYYAKLTEIILQPKPSLSKLKLNINKVIKKKAMLVLLYHAALAKFPDSEEVNENFGSLLLGILCDIDKGQFYLDKIETDKKFNCMDGKSSTINNQSFILISGKSNNIGKILYASKGFINIIGVSKELLQTSLFSNFLPCIIAKQHDALLLNFIDHCIDIIVYESLPLFILDYQGFLIECFISIECVGSSESANFLCSIEPINSTKREFAVIDLSGLIYSHSKNFLKILGCEQKYGENINIQYYAPEIIINDLIIDFVYEIQLSNNNNKNIKIILRRCKINDIKIFALFITDDINNQENLWKNLDDFYILEKDYYSGIEEMKQKMWIEDNNTTWKKETMAVSGEDKQKAEKNIDKSINISKPQKGSMKMLEILESPKNIKLELNRKESMAVNKSTKALQISKILLFTSVNYN